MRAFEPESFEMAMETARSLEWPEWQPTEERQRELVQWLDGLEALPERERRKRSSFSFQLGHRAALDDSTGRTFPVAVYLTIRRS